jgi:hypothetical protein
VSKARGQGGRLRPLTPKERAARKARKEHRGLKELTPKEGVDKIRVVKTRTRSKASLMREAVMQRLRQETLDAARKRVEEEE